MDKRAQLLKAIEDLVKEEGEELKEELLLFPVLEETLKAIESFETKVASLLRAQKQHFVNGLKTVIVKEDTDTVDEDTIRALLIKLVQSDDFTVKMSEYASEFLSMTIEEFVGAIMENLDKDVPFEILSDRVVDWIKEWSVELSDLMNLTTHTALENALREVIENGEGINKATLRIKDLPEFDRARARTTAITEVLRANSVAAHEAYVQSPAVTKKMWRHSGSKKNKPREVHVKLDGKAIGVHKFFNVGGYKGLYPRDKNLPASEVVNCHCVLSPVVDPKILGLSKEEKLALRDQAIAEANEKWAKEKK